MKLLRIGQAGRERPALFAADGSIRDVSAHVPDFTPAALASGALERLAGLSVAALRALPVIAPDGQRIGAPMAEVGDIVCIGLNYADHAAEAGMPVPDEPVVFTKKRTALSGPTDAILLPPGGERVDWEVELGVVIGRRARYLPSPQAAVDVIAGYCVCNDVSERTFQLDRGGQWVKGKSCETFNPMGPWLVTPDEVPDAQSLHLTLTVNGQTMQRGTTATMIFPVPHLLWYLSQFMVLEPGDLVNTGTPPGVGMGRTPPRYLQPGDVVEATIDGLGTQSQRCEAVDEGAQRV